MTSPGILTYAEAVELLPDTDRIHMLTDGGFALISGTWPRTAVLALLGNAEQRNTTCPPDGGGHGLVAYLPLTGTPVYIETRAAA